MYPKQHISNGKSFSKCLTKKSLLPSHNILGIFIPPVYEVYRGYIVFVFSVTMFVCMCVCVCKFFFSSKISQELQNLGF